MSRASRGSGRLSGVSSISGDRDVLDNQATEELTGFQWDEGSGGMHEFGGADALSEIGGVVSQVEANMDFTTNLDAAMEGVQKHQEPQEKKTRGAYANIDDISLSRFADSYWKVSDDAAGEEEEEGSDLGLETMELSTQTVETTNGNRQMRTSGPGSQLGERGNQEMADADNDDSFLARANDALRAGSRASSRRTTSQRPGSHHSVHSFREMESHPTTQGPPPMDMDEEEEQERLPTFSSPRQSTAAPALALAPAPAPARPGFNMVGSTMSLDLTRPPFLAADSASTVNDGADSRYARLVARYSGVPQQLTATGRIMADHLADDLSSEALSLLDTPGMNATAGFSSDQMSLASSPGIGRTAAPATAAGGGAARSPMRGHPSREPPRFGAQQTYYDATNDGSFESLDHPNMGSQGSPQAAQTVRTIGAVADPAYYDREQRDAFDMGELSDDDDTEEFGDGRINSLGSHAHMSGSFRSLADADELFGDRCTTSDPDMSSIIRDHERVFSDLFDSDDDLEAMQPPDSLFASSTSIVAELSRRRQQQRQNQQSHRVSTWDGREATADALMRQEAQFGNAQRNPIEMLEKTNSLGIATEDDSDVSGLFPESAVSPGSVGSAPPQPANDGANRGPPVRIRSNTGMQPIAGLLRQRRQREQLQLATGRVGGMPTTPQSAPMGGPYAHQAPPPTTPTTFIMRDTQHRPASRVLRQVSPLDSDFDDSTSTQQQSQNQVPRRANHGLGLPRLPQQQQQQQARRPAGPRAPEHVASQRIASTHTDATSSVGLGSLLHDSSLAPAELPRTPVAGTPRTVPFNRRINGDSPLSAASNTTTMQYVPFQEPTVDVSRLPHYRDVGVGRMGMQSSPRRQRPEATPVLPGHSPSVGSDTVPTTAADGPPQNGPSLRDIYDLLQRTVSTVDAPHQQFQQEEEEADAKRLSDGDHMIPRQLQSSFIETRPSAPTPRRSRRNHWHGSDESDDNVPVGRPRGDTGQSRVRAYLHRFASEPAGGFGDYDPATIPSPLAEKLVELASLLARNRAASSSPTNGPSVPTAAPETDHRDALLLRQELVQLQRQILARFDEHRAEIDMLRAEVRHASAAPSTAPRMASVVAPHDSVSVAGSAQPRDADDVFSVDSRPLMQTMPPTAKNKQRHMVQWLSSQQGQRDGSPTGERGGGGRRRRTTVEDMPDEPLPPARDFVYGEASAIGDGAGSEASNEGDALSDASTTVPDDTQRMAMRAPIGPYIGGPQAGTPPPKRDLLEMRELLHSVRHRSNSKRKPKRDDGEMLYSKQLAQQLAATLAELQRVHVRHFHNGRASQSGQRSNGACAVCVALDAQNHDPYLYGRNAIAYRSMTTRQLQGLLNAYVAAMEDEFGSDYIEPVARMDQSAPVRHVFTPSRQKQQSSRQEMKEASAEASHHSSTTRMVIGLLREELDALSRRYHRLVDEFHGLDPSNSGHQRKRRAMTRELKDLVDMLDVKGEQIAMLSALHPADASDMSKGKRNKASDKAGKKMSDGANEARLSAERAFQSARALQQALGELY
ncbi:hypothetical protein EV175_000022 [Coemansia sp. RSA 1933]|nr:hypothetical protein EV175_000022 [Coemansia sp. RSA 1933]